MPVTFNLRHLERKNLRLQGLLEPAELDVEGIDELVHLHQPVEYDLEVARMEEDVLVQGTIRGSLDCECARCLKPFRHPIDLDPWQVDLPLTGEERVPVDNDSVDLTPLIREDILLAFPQHPLCTNDCRGLPEAPQGLSRSGSGADAGKNDASSPWAELNKLKLT